MGGKLLNDIKSMCSNSLAFVRVKGCESECFMINSGVRQVCIMSPWLFNVTNAVMMDLKMGMGRRGVRFKRREEGVNCLASCMQMTCFCVVSRRKT